MIRISDSRPADDDSSEAKGEIVIEQSPEARTWLRIDANLCLELILTAPDPIALLDTQGRITFANQAWRSLLGREPRELIGAALQSLISEGEGAGFEQALEHAIQGGQIEPLDLTFTDFAGGRRFVRANLAGIAAGDGLAVGIFAILHDLTQRREFEEVVRRREAEASEQRAQFLAEASKVLAAVSLDYGAALEQLARLALPYLADWCMVDVVEDDQSLRRVAVIHRDPAKHAAASELQRRRVSARGAIVDALSSGNSRLVARIREEELPGLVGDPENQRIARELGLCSAMFVPLRARNRTLGVISFITADSERTYGDSELGLAQDLAARAALAVDNARLYHASQQALRSRDEFLATLGHELRNPLGAITHALKILEHPHYGEERVDRQVSLIGRQVRHLSKLVDDLLDLSRISSGKISLELRPVDLYKVADRSVQSFQAEIEERRHDVRLSPPEAPVVVEADPIRLEQLINNLLSNAIKYTQSEGKIQITVGSAEGNGIVRVKDNGVGIAPEMLEKIFEPFAQAAPGLDRTGGGLGLGLAVVRRLLEQHGGRIEASSAGLSKGSEFSVYLPLSRRPEAAREQEESRGNGRSRRILLIDDNKDCRNALRELLEISGHQVEVAEDGELGLQRALKTPPEVALIDIGLPGMNGYETARRLRADPHARHTFLIALTGYGQPEDRRRAMEAGFNAHLVKPVDTGELMRLLESAR